MWDDIETIIYYIMLFFLIGVICWGVFIMTWLMLQIVKGGIG